MGAAEIIAFIKAIPKLVTLIVELKDDIQALVKMMKIKEIRENEERMNESVDALIQAKTKDQVRDALLRL